MTKKKDTIIVTEENIKSVKRNLIMHIIAQIIMIGVWVTIGFMGLYFILGITGVI